MNYSNRAEAIGRLAALTGVHWKLPKCTAVSSHELLLMDHPESCERERLVEDVGCRMHGRPGNSHVGNRPVRVSSRVEANLLSAMVSSQTNCEDLSEVAYPPFWTGLNHRAAVIRRLSS